MVFSYSDISENPNLDVENILKFMTETCYVYEKLILFDIVR